MHQKYISFNQNNEFHCFVKYFLKNSSPDFFVLNLNLGIGTSFNFPSFWQEFHEIIHISGFYSYHSMA